MASMNRISLVRFLDSPDLRRRYVDSVLKLKRDGIYQIFVDWHADPLVAISVAHSNCAFPAWHRVFVRLFEIQLQKADEDLERARTGAANITTIALPYWDYTILNSADPDSTRGRLWNRNFLGGTGPGGVSDGQFSATGGNWNISERAPSNLDMSPFSYTATGGLRRNLGRSGLNLPSSDEIDHVTANISTFDTGNLDDNITQTGSFRNVLEGFSPTNVSKKHSESQMHNGTHGWVGGQMGRVPESPNDPVFWLHHCNVDRLWAKWQVRHVQAAQYPSDAQVDAARVATGNTNLVKRTEPMRPWNADNKPWVAADGATVLFRTKIYTVRDVLNWGAMGSDLGGYEYDDVNSRNFSP